MLRFPSHEALYTIYSSILTQHLKRPVNKFNNAVIKMAELIVQLAINFHDKILTIFLPTAVKFHYVFNLRDMSNVFQVFEKILFRTTDGYDKRRYYNTSVNRRGKINMCNIYR